MEEGTIVIGSPYADGYEAVKTGLITVFVYQGAGVGWHHSQTMGSPGPNTGDGFGQSVAITNQRIAVGAYGEDSNATLINGDSSNNTAANAGAAYIYDRHPTFYEHVWHPTTYIKASNTDAVDIFGRNLAFCGPTLLVGAPYEDSAAQGTNGNQTNNSLASAGAVYRYIWDGSQWQHRHYNKALNPDALDYFGMRLACHDQLLAVSAPGEDSAAQGVNGDQTDNSALDAGAVYVLSLPMQGYTHLPAVTGEEITSPYPLPQR